LLRIDFRPDGLCPQRLTVSAFPAPPALLRVGAGQELGTLADRLAAVSGFRSAVGQRPATAGHSDQGRQVVDQPGCGQDRTMAGAHRAGVGNLHSLRSCRLRSVVEDLGMRGIRPHHVGRMHQILLVVVGLAGEEHFAVAGHDPAVELPVDGLVDLELDHSGWFSSSWVPGGAHQRRVIRGRRAVCSQPDLIIVIILMSKLRPHRIGRSIRRYELTDRRATCRPGRKLVPVGFFMLALANRGPTVACLGLHHRPACACP
jgi:hypothetical protein